MTIEIRQEQVGEVHVLALAGRLDTETSADLELALQDLQATGATRFVIDLGEIGYVSSAGLRVLLALAKQLDGGRGSLKLCALNEAVKQVFDVAGFSRLFAIFPDRDAALGATAAAAPPASARAAAGKPKPQEAELARSAAELLGVGGGASGTPAPGSAELARTAAQLLGVSGKAKAARTADPPPQPAAPKPAPSEPAKPELDAAHPGVLGKFRNLFGKK